MAIPGGYVVISDFTGPLGTAASGTILDEQYGHVTCAAPPAMPTYVTDGLELAYAGGVSPTVTYTNTLAVGGAAPIVPTGLGIRFRPQARRFDVKLGEFGGDWGVMVNMGLPLTSWDFPDAVFDFEFTEARYFHAGLDAWYEFALLDSGYWCLTAGGATVDEGNIGPRPNGGPLWVTAQAAQVSVFDDFGGAGTVASMWLYGIPDAPFVRLFPRDDGLGMSGAPRIWPPPKNSHRIIGGMP